jgi:hypothetical protein
MQSISGGHISVCIAKSADLLAVVDAVRAYLREHAKA